MAALMSPPPSLKLWDNGHDFAVAATAEEAHEFLRHLASNEDEPFDADNWTTWPDDKPFTRTNDEGKQPVTKTAAEWCASSGAGYFASRDF